LKQFTNQSLQALVALNSEIVTNKLKALGLPRLTLDFDGSVLTCGRTVGWAFRGYNPHRRYAPSYYPLLCHIAQTGHFLEVKNRPGNVHDSKRALEVIRRCVDPLRAALTGVTLEARLDAAFFQKEILGWLDRHGIEFAVKVPRWNWLGIKQAARVSSGRPSRSTGARRSSPLEKRSPVLLPGWTRNSGAHEPTVPPVTRRAAGSARSGAPRVRMTSSCALMGARGGLGA